jgi:hypothetical protein
MRFVITSGTGIREIIEERGSASLALEHVQKLVAFRRPAVRVFDPDGHEVTLEKLRRLARLPVDQNETERKPRARAPLA